MLLGNIWFQHTTLAHSVPHSAVTNTQLYPSFAATHQLGQMSFLLIEFLNIFKGKFERTYQIVLGLTRVKGIKENLVYHYHQATRVGLLQKLTWVHQMVAEELMVSAGNSWNVQSSPCADKMLHNTWPLHIHCRSLMPAVHSSNRPGKNRNCKYFCCFLLKVNCNDILQNLYLFF